jgi:hypothetical protein
LGDFGDGILNTLDLINALRAVTNLPGFLPLTCSDLFDAMDSYPVDGSGDPTILPGRPGGDGLLGTLDLIETLKRVTNIDASRPRRTSRGLTCKTQQAQNVRPARSRSVSQANASSQADAALEFDADGSLYLHAFRDLHVAGLAASISSTEGDRVSWLAAGGVPPTLLDQDLQTVVAVAWLDGLDVSNGKRLRLGQAQTAHPERLHVVGTSGNHRTTGRDMKLIATDPPGRP